MLSISITVEPQYKLERHIERIRDSSRARNALAMETHRECELVLHRMVEGDKLFPMMVTLYVTGPNREALETAVSQTNALLVPTGLRVQIPDGYEMQIRPRSSLALKHGVTLPNTPGTIDSDYRGPLGVIMINLGAAPYTIHHGERIAQAVIAPVIRASYVIAETLDQTQRGAGGFGSTGRG